VGVLPAAAGPGDDEDDDDDRVPGGGGSGGNIDPDEDEGYDEDDDDDEEQLQVGSLCIRQAATLTSTGGSVRCVPHCTKCEVWYDSFDAASCEFRRLPAACVIAPRQPDHRFLISRFILSAVRV